MGVKNLMEGTKEISSSTQNSKKKKKVTKHTLLGTKETPAKHWVLRKHVCVLSQETLENWKKKYPPCTYNDMYSVGN